MSLTPLLLVNGGGNTAVQLPPSRGRDPKRAMVEKYKRELFSSRQRSLKEELFKVLRGADQPVGIDFGLDWSGVNRGGGGGGGGGSGGAAGGDRSGSGGAAGGGDGDAWSDGSDASEVNEELPAFVVTYEELRV